jgi:hypothetical protein
MAMYSHCLWSDASQRLAPRAFPDWNNLSKERWHRGLIVLGMHNPCDLGQKDIYVLDKLHVLELCVPQLLAATTYDKGHNMI